MAWLIIQSLPIVILCFLLGLLVGWLWWRRRSVQFGASDALTEMSDRHAALVAAQQDELDRSANALAEKDLEISRLTGLVSDDAMAMAAQHEGVVAAKNAEIAELTAQRDAHALEVAARGTALEAREAEIGRLSALVDRAEADAAARRDELARRDTRTAELAATVTDRDAEIDRLSAALAAVTAPGVPPTTEPTEPTTEELAPLVTPVTQLPAVVTLPGEAGPDEAAVAPDVVDLVAVEPAEDDLERVEGIGPRIGSALRGAGILTFRQLADADTPTLQGALEQAGLRFAPSLPTWSRQAALLADGDEAGFVEFTERLIAGRDVSGAK